MKIAIQAADLDAARIDGTRVYILNLLKYFGILDQTSDFLIYHKNKFNPELTPPAFTNYKIRKIPFPYLWTQTRFCWNLRKDQPDILWMPMHNIPIFTPKRTKTFVTIHDLAFKYYPEYFPRGDLMKLNILINLAIKRSDKIIAVSESTKRDILKFYPEVSPDKIRVIYHGFDEDFYNQKRDPEADVSIKREFGLSQKYILYTGALQPRKNLIRLIEAFDILKRDGQNIQLVLAGEKAWMYEEIFDKIEKSPNKKDIINTGGIGFRELSRLMRGASVFVFPSLYEGFGIPVLEAMASRVPVVLARNSSLIEVGGEAALYFETESSRDLASKIRKVLEDKELSRELIIRGSEQIKKFSWEKCARETLNYLKS